MIAEREAERKAEEEAARTEADKAEVEELKELLASGGQVSKR